MSYIAHSEKDKKEMLSALGIRSGDIDELFKGIPESFKKISIDLPEGRSEFEIEEYLKGLAGKNATELVTFVGGGFYDHYIPAAIDALVSRQEFYSAYTPYQPEASQGTLQAMYEYQSLICRLTSMEAANASLYDGGTALYEAAMMAVRITGRKKIIMGGGVNPIYRKMMYSYTTNLSIDFVETEVSHGQSSRGGIKKHLDEETAAVIVQNPNFFGCLDDFTDVYDFDAEFDWKRRKAEFRRTNE